MADLVMPRLSDTMEEGTILRWLVADGEPVKRGQELVEIETEKHVFVPADKGPANRTFTLRPVETGRQLGDRVVVECEQDGARQARRTPP